MKRALDLVTAVAASIALALPMIAISLLVVTTSEGPAIHWSRRVGRHGSYFLMPKFRTMKLGTPQVATDLLMNPQSRLTPVGGFLRKLSLDELPQLWSVIKGDMSIVGPRPALFNQTDLIAAREAAGVHALRPGITGLAQVNGRDDLSEAQKVALDAEYRLKSSVAMDLRIIAITAMRVLRREGVSH